MKDFIVFIAGTLFSAVALFGAFCFGGAVGVEAGRQAAQREAVEHRAGQWTIDPATGAKTFVWIEHDAEAK